jgi:hypothetical protein
MKEEIAKNEYYEFYVDTQKNRIYLTMKGYWPSAEAIGDYISDLKKCLGRMRPGYTSLVDMTQGKIPHKDAFDVLMKGRELTIQAGLGKQAQIVTEPLEKLASDRIDKETGIEKEKVRKFNAISEAETWLDA